MARVSRSVRRVEHQGRVGAAKAKGIGQRRPDWTLARGARSIGVSTEGLSRLSVGGATWSRIARIEKMASTAPAAPRRWPIEDLVDDMVVLAALLPSSRSTA